MCDVIDGLGRGPSMTWFAGGNQCSPAKARVPPFTEGAENYQAGL
ncbi:hypothetical protein K788_00027180 [Paraburkholderia caribensis MBA4]|uniref:Uncharacterized protein n=1 Tax=Paraburkholderia caribensis MBA4 TaxID=1323664 RepID=A0A0P0RG52_9BURK|nr:hypothetical protein K788_00027180 [Paraburkholderia caribensis MBA4]